MRSLLASLLVLILPLQLSFAAGGEYCESSKAHGSHFGHHAHKPAEADTSCKPGEPAKKSVPDCGVCFLGCAHAQLSTFELSTPADREHFTTSRVPLPPGIILAVPDLPPRAALA